MDFQVRRSSLDGLEANLLVALKFNGYSECADRVCHNGYPDLA